MRTFMRRNNPIPTRSVPLVAVLCILASASAPAEIIFQDHLVQPSNPITASVPALDVEGGGWQLAPGQSAPYLDGSGHVADIGTNGATACVPLIPIGPHGSMTLTATFQIPAGSPKWIGMGFASTNQVLAGSGSR